MERLEPVLAEERPDLVIVPGDVNSTLAAALTAAKMQIPVAHIESGLRSFDRTMPEELNRIVTDQLSDQLFIHSPEANDNLHAEGIPAERIHFVGNTMIDTLVALEERFRAAGARGRLGVEPGEYVLVTLHRPALVDGPLLAETIEQLAALAREMPVVFPVHPRTRAMMEAIDSEHPGLLLCEPLGYLDFLSLLADAGAVLTDSGGIQEETTYLGIPCFTLRDNTERPITITAGTNTLLGLDPAAIAQIPAALAQRPANDPSRRPSGTATQRSGSPTSSRAKGRRLAASPRRHRRRRTSRLVERLAPRRLSLGGRRLLGSRLVSLGRRLLRQPVSQPRRRRRRPRLRVSLGSTLAASLPGASSMLMLRPSCSGWDSITARPSRSSKRRCSSARPRSGWACSRPRNMIVTLTLSWWRRKRSTWPFLVS